MIVIGQLRRWTWGKSVKGKLFIILGRKWYDEPSPNPVWEFMTEGIIDWHCENVIEADSEIVQDTYVE